MTNDNAVDKNGNDNDIDIDNDNDNDNSNDNDDDNDKDNDNDNDNDNEGPCYGRGWLHLLAKPLYVSLMRVHQALQLRSYPTIAYLHPMSTVVLHVCLL